MALPFPIAAAQTDAKSPIDQQLMDAIRLNQEYLDSQIGGASAGGIINFRVNGYLNRIKALLAQGAGKHLDCGIISNNVTLTAAKLYLENAGTSGALEVDVLRHKEVQHGIDSIEAQYTASTQAVGRVGSSLNTQAISRATPNINTQSITYAKPALSISSIIAIPPEEYGGLSDYWLITFTGATLLDSDYETGDYVVISGATAGGNNVTKGIERVNYDGLPSIVINNNTGVEQLAPAGSADLKCHEFTYLASVDPNFTVGEILIQTGHGFTGGAMTIFKTNQAGNNIWLKHLDIINTGVPAGSVQCGRYVYSYAAPVDATQYIVGEKANFSGHTSGSSNGQFEIITVNDGGNNLKVFNIGGLVQAGVAGIADTLRWVYSMPTDPTTSVTIGDSFKFSGHTSAANDGTFEIKLVNRFAVNNLEIYNPSGVTQGAAAGSVESNLKIIKFRADYSSIYTAGTSKAALEGVVITDTDKKEYDIVEVNRGGFSNYNIVIEAESVLIEAGSKGRVAREVRTIFIDRPRLEIDNTNNTSTARFLQKDLSATLEASAIDADTILSMDILEVPEGLPSTMVLSLS